ncbi:MAG TPA: hypothetical protein VKG01_11765 [Thermoanaerobaculia bacterium]|nr:hypothetical protein [Thermoanaerobaculia bacterium]
MSRRLAAAVLGVVSLAAGAAADLLGSCGPFTDLADPTFCSQVLEIYTLGITTGTTATTYSPNDDVSRLQMAIFLSRSVDKLLLRRSQRTVLKSLSNQPGGATGGLVSMTTVGTGPTAIRWDGTDVWVANTGGGTLSRLRGSDGKVLETWPSPPEPNSLLIAMGSVFVTDLGSGAVVKFDPALPPGSSSVVASTVSEPISIAFDGLRLWVISQMPGSASIITPGPTTPWTVTTATTGLTGAYGAVFDGSNVWVTAGLSGTLLKLNSSGIVLQTVTVGSGPSLPLFDGTNIWVPNSNGHSVSIVRPSTGSVLATLTGSGLNAPNAAAFDGERVLITSKQADFVSLWKAADLTNLGFFPASSQPASACSDGVHFWVALAGSNQIARF